MLLAEAFFAGCWWLRFRWLLVPMLRWQLVASLPLATRWFAGFSPVCRVNDPLKSVVGRASRGCDRWLQRHPSCVASGHCGRV